MRTLGLSTAALALATAPIPAIAHTLSVGSMAAACYAASLSHRVAPSALDQCTFALEQERLSYRDRVATHVNRGIVRMNLRDHVGAERDFDIALRMNQNAAEAWLNKGLLRLRQERPEDAMPLIQRALETNTIRPALAMYARGLANEQLGDLKAAYSDLKRAREMAPGWSAPAEELKRYSIIRASATRKI